MIDLHVHSTCSDGTYTPRMLVEYALTHDISAFALTDHDTTAGLDEAISYANELSGIVCEQNPDGHALEVLPGIEFSTEYEGRDIHVVGLMFDHHDPVFEQHIQAFIDSRKGRNEKMCAALREHGVPVTYEELKSAFPGSVITRAHYGRFMLEHGYVKSIAEAFERYVGDNAPCFIPREKVTPAQAVELIRKTGGIPVLAHPTLYKMGHARLEKLVSEMTDAGMLAMEGIYSSYSTSETREMQALARKYGLGISGGSDFHGDNKPGLFFGTGYGKLYIHEEVLEKLKALKP